MAIYELEERIYFDAALPADIAEANNTEQVDEPAQTENVGAANDALAQFLESGEVFDNSKAFFDIASSFNTFDYANVFDDDLDNTSGVALNDILSELLADNGNIPDSISNISEILEIADSIKDFNTTTFAHRTVVSGILNPELSFDYSVAETGFSLLDSGLNEGTLTTAHSIADPDLLVIEGNDTGHTDLSFKDDYLNDCKLLITDYGLDNDDTADNSERINENSVYIPVNVTVSADSVLDNGLESTAIGSQVSDTSSPESIDNEELNSSTLLTQSTTFTTTSDTSDHQSEITTDSESLQSPASLQSNNEVVFINSSVMDSDEIVNDLSDNAEVVYLTKGTDGIQQITDYLSDKTDIDTVRIISHGNEGYFVLNGQIIDSDYITEHSDIFAEWSDSLSENADIMLYGCNLAATAEGQDLVQHIADLTGADVAAATHATGGDSDYRLETTDYGIYPNDIASVSLQSTVYSLQSNAGWDLDFSIGSIESSQLDIDGYEYHLANQTVTSNADDGGGGETTLREAIAAVGDGEEITFDITSYTGDQDTIIISSEFSISGKGMTIDGYNNTTGNDITVQAPNIGTGPSPSEFRVFGIDASGKTVTLENMTIKGGNISSSGDTADGYGGAIYIAAGTVNLDKVTVSSSKAYSGGGIYNTGTLSATNSTISGNYATGDGGGIYNTYTVDSISNSLISANIADNSGGGILNDNGAITISNSTIYGNTATLSNGGGIANSGVTTFVDISDSTISDNSASQGNGDGVYFSDPTLMGGGTLTLSNSIIARNDGSDLYIPEGVTFFNHGYNVVKHINDTSLLVANDIYWGDYYGYGDMWVTDNGTTYIDLNHQNLDLDDSLRDNGGFTQTLAVTGTSDGFLTTSQAYGYSSGQTDQRGYYRTDEVITRGAYQYNGVVAKIGETTSWTGGTGIYTTINDAITAANNNDIIILAGTPIVESSIDINKTISEGCNITVNGENSSTIVRVELPGVTAERIFNISGTGSGELNISDMTIKGGSLSTGYGGAIYITAGNVNLNNVTVSGSSAIAGGGIANNGGVLTVTSSTFRDNSADLSSGGAIYNYGTLTVTSSTFSDNSAYNGGGIFNQSGTATVSSSTFSGNSATIGGGIYNSGTLIVKSSSILSENTASTNGGGIYNTATLTVSSSTLDNNTASGGGGGIFIDSGTATIELSTAINNMASSGGGIANNSSGTLTVSSSTFNENSATTDSTGGGGILNSGILTVESSTFSDNTASSGSGGGIYNTKTLSVESSTFSSNSAVYGGGIINFSTIDNPATVTVESSTFNANSATSGGGIYQLNGTTTVESSTFNANSATSGGGLYDYRGTLVVISSTFSGNSATTAGGIYLRESSAYLLNSIIINNTGTNGDIYRYNTEGDLYAYYSWYYDTDGTINTQTAAPTVTTAYTEGDLGTLQDNGGSTYTMALSAAAPGYQNGTYVYYNETDGFYFLDSNGYSRQLTNWDTCPTVNPSDKITVDQRGETITGTPSIGSYTVEAAVLYYMAKVSGDWDNYGTVWFTSVTESTDPDDYTTQATEAPTASNSAGIIINDSIDVTVTTDFSIDQTAVNIGASIIIDDGVTLTVANGDGTDLTAEGSISVNNESSSGILLIASGASADSNNEFTVNGILSFDDGGVNNGTLNLAGSSITIASLTAGSSTITYDGGNQTVAALTYNTLSFTGSTTGSTKTFADGTTKIAREISITDTMTLSGSSSGTVTVQVNEPGVSTCRVFNIYALSETVTINNMTVKGGDISSLQDDGGGIYINFGSLNLNNVTVSGSKARDGGGIFCDNATVTINNSTISNNVANLRGGGIGTDCSVLYLNNSTVNDNQSLSTSSLYGGGGLFVKDTTATIELSTFAGNTANSKGGGIRNEYVLNIYNSTISSNYSYQTTASGGGIYNKDMISIQNTIIANNYNNAGLDDFYNYTGKDVYDMDYNIIGVSEGYTWASDNDWNIVGTSGGTYRNVSTLEEGYLYVNTYLTYNGGLTKTLEVYAAGSIAVNHGYAADSSLETDQRGFYIDTAKTGATSRTIGAYEYNAKVASIDGTFYNSLSSAIEAASSGDTVQLVSGYIKGSMNSLMKNITITGNGSSGTYIQAGLAQEHSDNVFDIGEGYTVNLSDLTVRYSGGSMAAISNSGTLNIDNCSISYNYGMGYGGAISNWNSGILNISDSTFDSNFAYSYGGAIFNRGTTVIVNSTFCSNTSNSSGGAIYNSNEYEGVGALTIKNSTIAYNYSDFDNSGDETGGGINFNSGTFTVSNTIIANNYRGSASTSRDDFYTNATNITDNNYNVMGVSNYSWTESGDWNIVGTSGDTYQKYGTSTTGSLNLASSLADNGGGTLTLALTTGSIAIDAIPKGSLPYYNNSPAADQRGVTRTGNYTSIGAFNENTVSEYYYRTNAVGSWDWSTAANWQISEDGETGWITATESPDYDNSLGITVRNGTDTDTSATNVLITSDLTIDQTTVNSNATLTVNSGVTLIVNDGTGTDLTNAGTFVNSGTLTNSGSISVTGTYSHAGTISGNALSYSGSASTLIYSGTSQQTTTAYEFASSGGPSNLTIDNSSGVILDFTRTLSGNLTVTSGEFNVGANSLTISGTTDIDGTLRIGAGMVDANGTFNAAGGTIDFTDAGNLMLGGEGETIESLGSLDISKGTVWYDSEGVQTVLADAYYNLKIYGSGTKSTASGTVSVCGDLTVSAEDGYDVTFLVSESTSIQVNHMSTISETLNVEYGAAFTARDDFDATYGTVTLDDGGTLYISDTVSSFGTLSGDGTVCYNDTDDGQVINAITYDCNLKLEGGSKTPEGEITVNGDFNLNLYSTDSFSTGSSYMFVLGSTTITTGKLWIGSDSVEGGFSTDGTTSVVNGTLFLNSGEYADNGNTEIGDNGILRIKSGTYYSAGDFNANTSGVIDFVIDDGYLELDGSVTSLGNLDTSNGTVNYIGVDQTVISDYYYNLEISSYGNKNTEESGLIRVSGDLTVSVGDVSDYKFTISDSGTVFVALSTTITGELVISDNAELETNGTFNATGGTIDFTGDGNLNLKGLTTTSLGMLSTDHGTVTYDRAGSQTVLADTYYNLVISGSLGSTKTLGGAITVNNDFMIDSGRILDVSENDYGITVGGDWSNSGTFTAQNGLVSFTGSTLQSISGTNTFYDLTIANTHATEKVTATGTLAVEKDLSITDGIFYSASDYHNVLIGENGILELSDDITVSGNWANSGTFTHNDNTVTFDGTETSVISGTNIFYNFTSVTAGKTLTFSKGTGNLQTVEGTFTLTGSDGNNIVVNSDASGTQAEISVTNYSVSYVTVKDSNNSSGTDIQASNSTDGGNNTGWSFNASSYYYRTNAVGSWNWSTAANWQISEDGETTWTTATESPDYDNSLGITVRNGTDTDTSATNILVATDLTIDQITINGATLTVNSEVTLTVNDGIGTDLTNAGTLVNSGTLTNSGSIFVTGTYSHAGTISGNALSYSGSSSTLIYSGTSQQTTTNIEFSTTNGPAKLTVSNTEGVVLNSDKEISGDLTIDENCELDGTYSFTVGGNASLSGNLGNSTALGDITFNGAVTIENTISIIVTENSAITFNSTIDSASGEDNGLSIGTNSYSSNLVFNGIIGGTEALYYLQSYSDTLINANITTTELQCYWDSVQIGTGVTLVDSSNGIDFHSTVDSESGENNSLTISGDAEFMGAVGGTTVLDSLSISGTSSIESSVTTSGAETYTGAVTLTDNTTLTGSSVTFSSTVNSESGENNTLTVNGAASVNGSIGLTTALGDITFNNAVTLENTVSVIVAENSTLTFGSTINSASGEDNGLSVGTDSYSSNLVLNGVVGGNEALYYLQSYSDTLINANITTAGIQCYWDAVEIGTAVTLTDSTNGIDFWSTVNSESGENNSLTINGEASLAANIGMTAALGNTVFNGAVILEDTVTVKVSENSTITFNSTLDTKSGEENGISIGTNSYSSNLVFNGIIGGTEALYYLQSYSDTLINANITTAGIQSYWDNVQIGNDVTLVDSTNGIDFHSTVNSESGESNTLIISGDAEFMDAVGGTTVLDSLSVSGTSSIESSVISSGAQNYIGAVILTGSTTLTGDSITFSSTVNSESGENNILTVNGAVSLNGNIGNTTALGDTTFNNAVTLENTVSVLVAESSTLTFSSTINSASGEENGLTVGTDSYSSNLVLNGVVGGSEALYYLQSYSDTLINANITTAGIQCYWDAVEIGTAVTLTDSTNGIDFWSTVNSESGENNSLTINGEASLAANIGMTAALGNTVFNGAVTLEDTVTVKVSENSTITFNSTLDTKSGEENGITIGTDSYSSNLIINGLVGGTEALYYLQSYSDTLINANITTAGIQSYWDNVQIGNDVTLVDSTNGIDFHSTVDSESGESNTLIISGDAEFMGAVGGTTVLDSLSVSGTTSIESSVTSSGAQTYTGAVTLEGNVTATAGLTVYFESTVDSAVEEYNSLTVVGDAQFEDNVGYADVSLKLSSISVSGTSQIYGRNSTTGAQAYTGAVTIYDNAVFTGSTVTFSSTVDSASGEHHHMIVMGDGVFHGALGSSDEIINFQVSGTAALYANVSTTGLQRYAGALTLEEDAVLTAGLTVYFESTVDSASGEYNSLTVNGDAQFEDNVGATDELTSLTNNGNVTISGDTGINLVNNWDINGSLTIASGITLTGTSNTLTVSSNWTNNGTFNANSGTVTFDGTGTSVISGINTLYNFTCITAGKTLTFATGSGNLQTIEGTFTLTGTDGTNIVVNSDEEGTQAEISVTNYSVSYVTVQDSNNTSGTDIQAYNSTDSGNNTVGIL